MYVVSGVSECLCSVTVGLIHVVVSAFCSLSSSHCKKILESL